MKSAREIREDYYGIDDSLMHDYFDEWFEKRIEQAIMNFDNLIQFKVEELPTGLYPSAVIRYCQQWGYSAFWQDKKIMIGWFD